MQELPLWLRLLDMLTVGNPLRLLPFGMFGLAVVTVVVSVVLLGMAINRYDPQQMAVGHVTTLSGFATYLLSSSSVEYLILLLWTFAIGAVMTLLMAGAMTYGTVLLARNPGYLPRNGLNARQHYLRALGFALASVLLAVFACELAFNAVPLNQAAPAIVLGNFFGMLVGVFTLALLLAMAIPELRRRIIQRRTAESTEAAKNEATT